jgi:hypothetical protein
MKSNLLKQSNNPMSISRYKNAMMLSTDEDALDMDDQMFNSQIEDSNTPAADGLLLALQNQQLNQNQIIQEPENLFLKKNNFTNHKLFN